MLLRARDVIITNEDYQKCLGAGENVFVFADPPYDIKSMIYGTKGDLHKEFSHSEFANVMRGTKHNWLITYNDNASIRSMFADFNMHPLYVNYIMGNGTGKRLGNELMITNYDVHSRQLKETLNTIYT
jgi:DNA adenine methylase